MPVVQYVIQYEEITKNVEASKTEFEAPQLQRKKGYTFKVWPRNSAHRGPEKKITVTTKAFCEYSKYLYFMEADYKIDPQILVLN